MDEGEEHLRNLYFSSQSSLDLLHLHPKIVSQSQVQLQIFYGL